METNEILVLQKVIWCTKDPNYEKHGSDWEECYQVTNKGLYKLANQEGTGLSNYWNINQLKRYYY